jgi:hypothetical protein
VPRDDHRWELIQEERRFERRDPQPFDRLEFAMGALRVLKPPGMTVAVYQRRRELRVERGPDLARGQASSWAMVGIPPDASREHIAFALAELAGADDVPYMVEVLVAAGRRMA